MHLEWRYRWLALVIAALAGSGCSSAAIPARSGHGAPAGGKPIALTGPSSEPVTRSPSPVAAPSAGAVPAATDPVADGPDTAAPVRRRPLTGKIIGIDPGHNGRNKDDPAYINRLIWNGREWETCDTTGTETDGGYTEARFNFAVATYLKADLISDGAKVVMTRRNNDGVGPCVNKRAAIINHARANVAIDIHADGGPSWGRGFTVLEPVADGPNNKVIKGSVRFGGDVRAALLKDTTIPVSDYYGHHGIILRNDLAGLNLTTVPKILIECGNMRNATDARLLTRPSFQRTLARAFAAAMVKFLTRR
jgi:N-acetylmuramoyl-L-alanine amidase